MKINWGIVALFTTVNYLCIIINSKTKSTMKFKSDNDAKKKIESIAKDGFVYFTNDGLELCFTSEFEGINNVFDSLTPFFSEMRIKGRKAKTIVFTRKSQIIQSFKVTEVVY